MSKNIFFLRKTCVFSKNRLSKITSISASILVPTCLHVALQNRRFSVFGISKGLQNFIFFLHRIFIDFCSVLTSNMEPSWGPRRLIIRKNGSKTLARSSPRAALDTNLLLKTVQEPLGLDFGGGQGSIFDDFWMIFEASWLTLGMFSAALAGGTTPPPDTHPRS